VRRKKRNKRSEATGELEEGPDVLHFAHDPHRLLAFDRRGAHRRPGAPLARLKWQLAINTFLQRFPEASLAVTPEPVRWRQGLSLCGPEKLTLVVKGASA
jgi:cytochrome P450